MLKEIGIYVGIVVLVALIAIFLQPAIFLPDTLGWVAYTSSAIVTGVILYMGLAVTEPRVVKISAPVAVVASVPASEAPQAPQAPQAPPQHLRVASYNLRVDVDPAPHTWNERQLLVAHNIIKVDPDVVCLQESCGRYVSDLLTHLPGYSAVRSSRRATDSHETCDILYRTARLRSSGPSRTFQLSGKSEALLPCGSDACTHPNDLNSKHARIALVATLAAKPPDSPPFVVVSTHFPLTDESRVLALKSLDYIVGRIKQQRTVIIGGDFNGIVPTSKRWTVVGDPHQSTFGTYTAIDPAKPRLDYLMVRRAQVTGSGDLLAESGVTRGSDHSLVWTDITISATADDKKIQREGVRGK
jgi:endonuclease/exonuclease/phosphatase family metal-dependent hydrolase